MNREQMPPRTENALHILVIGASGFIGRHHVQHLVREGFSVYATHLPGESTISLPRVTWVACDLNAHDFERVLPAQFDSLVYLAQSPQWRTFPGGAADVFRVNVAAVFRAAEYARSAGARRFLFASSGSVYSQTEHPALENEAFPMAAPYTFYSASKLASELLLRPYNALFPVIILRIFVPYGSGQHDAMLIPQLVRRVREGRPIDLDGANGMCINPVAAADVAEALARCLVLNEPATLNVAGPQMLTLRDIGMLIGQALGKDPKFRQNDTPNAPVIAGDLTILRQKLGWTPSITFEQGLRMWLQSEDSQLVQRTLATDRKTPSR